MARSVRDPNTGCLEWQGCLGPNGYGSLGIGNKKIAGAHRVAYAAFKGEFDETLFVLHKCDNRKCINPDHLFVGTRQDNMDDMAAKGRKGPTNPKLSEDQVRALVEQLERGESNTKVAADFGIHRTTVSHIRRGRSWKRQLPRQRLPDARGRIKGEDCSNARLTNAEADIIRQKYASGSTQAELAREYSVPKSTIRRIVYNKSYVVRA